MSNHVEVLVLVIGLSLDWTVMSSLLVPESVIVISHDIGKIQLISNSDILSYLWSSLPSYIARIVHHSG